MKLRVSFVLWENIVLVCRKITKAFWKLDHDQEWTQSNSVHEWEYISKFYLNAYICCSSGSCKILHWRDGKRGHAHGGAQGDGGFSHINSSSATLSLPHRPAYHQTGPHQGLANVPQVLLTLEHHSDCWQRVLSKLCLKLLFVHDDDCCLCFNNSCPTASPAPGLHSDKIKLFCRWKTSIDYTLNQLLLPAQVTGTFYTFT